MAKKEYWKFAESFSAFGTLYEKGQPLKTSIAKMKEVFPTKPADEALILEGIRVYFPDYTITPQDRAERSSRREVSALGRETFFSLLHESFKAKESMQPGTSMHRSFEILFDHSGSPEAKDWNERVCSLFGTVNGQYVNGSPEARGEMIMEFIDRQMKTDFNRLYHMTDRELAENYKQLHSLFGLMAEGGDAILGMNGSVFTMPESYAEKAKALKATHQTQMGELRGRFEAIIDPNYEIFHCERMRAHVHVNVNDFDEEELEPLRTRIEANPQVRNYFDMMNSQNALRWASHFDKINHAIRELNLPEELLNPPVYENGKKVVSLLLDVTTLDGTPVLPGLMDDSWGFCFTNPITKQQHFLMSDGTDYRHIDFSHIPDPLKTDAEKALKTLEDADPWHIRNLTGSKEYKEMKASMKDVAELMQRMPKSPTKEQRDEFKTLLADLTQKQAAYAGSKAELSASTKDSERARISASNIVKKYIDDANLLLDGYEKAVSVRAAMKTEMKEARDAAMETQADAENNYQRPRTITNEVPRSRAAKERTEEERWADNDKVREAYGRYLEDNDPLKELGEDIHLYGYIQDDPNVLNMMAKMVTYDLIARERVSSKAGQAGPIERTYLAGKDAFIQGLERSESLKKFAASVEEHGEFRNFIVSTVGETIQKLSTTVLGEFQGKQMQQPEQPKKPTMEQVIRDQAPEPPKPAQGPLGKG